MADQNVPRLEIAMHDLVRMRVSNGLQHVEEQMDALFDTEPVLIAVGVDVIAVNVLEHEIRLSGVGQPGVDQFGYMGVRQTAQNDAFASESLLAGSADERDSEKLH